MLKRILIIGGYGNFGRYISSVLAKESDIQIIIAGRNITKAEQLIDNLDYINKPLASQLDININLSSILQELKPDIVIHTSGPFQAQSYLVAEQCIAHRCHYIDLADARNFVANVTSLDNKAKAAEVFVTSGASSVPTLTSAIIDHYLQDFSDLQDINYAISTAQLTGQGLATTQAILSYVGKPFHTKLNGKQQAVFGWQDLRIKKFWGLNYRCSSNCDIPDLELFPVRYQSLTNIRFQAGVESKIQHIGLYLLSWLVRFRLIKSLQPVGKLLLKISRLFDPFGSDNSGFYMKMSGISKQNHPQTICFDILAKDGHGLYIPCIPSILMAKKLARHKITDTGAFCCIGYISLDEYLTALQELHIEHRQTIC